MLTDGTLGLPPYEFHFSTSLCMENHEIGKNAKIMPKVNPKWPILHSQKEILERDGTSASTEDLAFCTAIVCRMAISNQYSI